MVVKLNKLLTPNILNEYLFMLWLVLKHTYSKQKIKPPKRTSSKHSEYCYHFIIDWGRTVLKKCVCIKIDESSPLPNGHAQNIQMLLQLSIANYN